LVQVLYARYEIESIEFPSAHRFAIDYQRFTDRIRTLQRTLITAHISLLRFDEKDVEVFRDDILPPTKLAFTRLRRDIDLTIREIGAALGCGPMFIAATQSGYLECLDQQRAAANAAKPIPLQRTVSRKTASEKDQVTEGQQPTSDEQPEEGDDDDDDVEANLHNVAKRLELEMGAETPARPDYSHPDTPTHAGNSPEEGTTAIATAHNTKSKGSPTTPKSPLPAAATTSKEKPAAATAEPPKHKYGPHMIKTHFEEFEAAQKDVFVDILTSAEEMEVYQLKVHEPGPSISEMYGGDYLRGDVEAGDLLDRFSKKDRKKSSTQVSSKSKDEVEEEKGGSDDAASGNADESDEPEDQTDADSAEGPTPQFKRNETLVRVYSLLFAWE
jgi:hypothetical protein